MKEEKTAVDRAIKCFDSFVFRVCSMQILQGDALGFIKNLKSREEIKKIKSGGQFLLVEKHNARICSKFLNIKKYVENCFL